MKFKIAIIGMIVAFATSLQAMEICSGESIEQVIDLRNEPLSDSVDVSYNSGWIGGDSSAEVVVSADGMEIKRMTGEGEFIWSPTTAGKHTLTYTTYIKGVAQDEVYKATVFKDWKYTVTDGKATIVDTTQKLGSVTIPSEIDGLPVVGIESDVYAGCHGLLITVPTGFTNVVSAVKSFEQNEWVRDDSESGEVYKSNDIDHNGSTYMIATVKGSCEFSFDWKVSSESGYDWLRWYLDGSQKAEISGERDWQTVTYSLPEGEHTIKWQYSKDGGVDNGSDCGWVRINENMTGLDLGDAIVIYNDYPFATGGDASWRNDEGLLLRSGSITNNLISWLEMTVPGPGKLTYKWKSSSEYYEDESEGIYEIYDYGYLSVDNEAMGGLNDEYALEGVAIGGHTDWQDVEFDVTGEGEHTLRWTYLKDEYDDEQMIGEDCIWVDQIKFHPFVTLSFDLGGGVGGIPSAIYELHETEITLPEDVGFSRDNHVFGGWSDGRQKYAAGETYVLPRTNITLRADWIEKRSLSFDLGGGVGTAPGVIKNIPGVVITLPDRAGFDRANYTFTGWRTGNQTYAVGSQYTIGNEDVVFIAQWSANTLSTPVISSRDIANGGILNTASATISISADSGASVYYTLDRSTPNAASVKYTAPFVADGLGSVTIKAIALRDNYFDSEVATFSFIRRPYSAAECLGVNGFVVVTEGDNAWFRVQGDSAHDGESALRSGAIGEGGSSVVQMTVYGKGTISFWWKSSSHDGNRNRKYDYVSFEVDEDGEQAWLGGEKDWVKVTYDVTDEGRHTLKWIYKKNSDGTIAGEDCAWLDEVVWVGGDKFDITYENLKGASHQNPSAYYAGMSVKFTDPSTVDGYVFTGWLPSEITASDTGNKIVTANWEWAPQDAVVDASVTGWKPVTVKAEWVTTELEQKFGAGKKEAFIARFGDNLTSAMMKKSGKKDSAGNELLVWHDYVAGTDPTDINSTFKANIEMQDGKPIISWEPNLNSVGEERVYTVYGKESLSDIWHSPIAALDHFFKVDVAMPREGMVTFDVGGGSSVNPISVRVGQAVGELPTPTRDGYAFVGWFTAASGGTQVTANTTASVSMTTLYAQWEKTHEKVQLWEGGPYWATTNIGAEKPEDYGYYFWWGDTIGYKREGNEWVASEGSNLDFAFDWACPTYDNSTLQSEGWITADGVLASEHDAAKKHWGGEWRMPTKQEFDELWNKCDWTWTTLNGVNGYIVCGKGDYSSASIFLPCAGRGSFTSLNSAGSFGNYWSSVPDSNYDDAWYLDFYSDGHYTSNDSRYYGQSVRPVQVQYVSVKFDVGGGSSVNPISVRVGLPLGELPTPTRDGYTFLGWFTTAEGGDAVTLETVVTADMTIYAHWTIKSYTVEFNANGGNGGVSKSYTHGAALGELPTPTRDGYTFAGWWTAVSGGAQVTVSTVVYADMTIYAHWTIKSHTVVFNANGGNGGVSKSYTHGATLGELPTPTRDGYAFLGWFTAASGGMQVTTSTIVTSSQMLYARWEMEISDDAHDKVQLWGGGPYWATTNIGAEKPEDSGYYFWWGDTIGYKRENDKWVASDGSSSNFSFTESNTSTQYKDYSTLQRDGWITAGGVLAPEYDAAKKHWGGDWRMPTKNEIIDLCSKCDWTRTTMNGINGYIVRGRDDYASASIFLPSVGLGVGVSVGLTSSYGYYWSSVPDSGNYHDAAWGICLNSTDSYTDYFTRERGQLVRPVQGATYVIVTFNTCGGSSVESISIPLGSVFGELPMLTREGYVFAGWWTAASGGTQVTASTVVTSSQTLYARWETEIPDDAHEKVQLWEDGPYWATTNLGAEKPEDYGYYFWWGDTVGYKRENDKWVSSDGTLSNFSFTESNTPTHGKYYSSNDYSTLESEGWVTAKGVLAPAYDAAQKHWGGYWRMPTKQEFDDLNSRCDWTWTTLNGVTGYVVRGRGDYASNSIFLPSSGYGSGQWLLNAEFNGLYWSSVPDSSADTYSFHFHSSYHGISFDYRSYGLPIRPLQRFTK